MATKKTKNEPSFEEALARLEEIVKRLESGAETLECSLQLYEEGVALVRACSARLEAAEQSVRMLRGTTEEGTPLWGPLDGEVEA